MSEVGSSVQSFYKSKLQAERNKGFRNSIDSKAITLKVLKMELLFNYKKKFRLKILNICFFLRTNLQKQNRPFSS